MGLLGLLRQHEGAGNPSTLFGHSQRSGGPFDGVDVSKMTIGQLRDFSRPDGAYGQWVKGQVGRVATPMGFGQIVGTTMRNTADALGLPDETVFDGATQSRMVNHLASQRLGSATTPQGKRAAIRAEWEGFKNVSDAELDRAIADFEQSGGIDPNQAIADDTMRALGRGPVYSTEIGGSGADTMNTQQQGLLGQIARPDEKVGGLLGMMFGNMSPDRADQLRANLGGLQGINNQGMVDGARGRMRARSGARENDLNYNRKQQQTEQERQREAQRTAQAQAYIAQNAPPEIVAAMRSGVLTPQQAYAIANNKPETYTQVTGADLGYTGEDAGNMFNVGPDGKITAIGGGGTSITNNLGGTSTAGWEAIDKKYAETWLSDSTSGLSDVASQAGTIAAVLGDLEAGKELTGPMVGIQGDFARAIMNPDAQDAKDRVESVVQRSLRETLGSQFTAQEGDRLIARSYNPMLPPEQNARRLRALLTTLQSVAQQKMDMRNHFNENGTLQGFNGSLSIPTVDDFIAIMDEASPSAEAPTETGEPKVLRFNEDGTLSDG